jgi:hypothetical protein
VAEALTVEDTVVGGLTDIVVVVAILDDVVGETLVDVVGIILVEVDATFELVETCVGLFELDAMDEAATGIHCE